MGLPMASSTTNSPSSPHPSNSPSSPRPTTWHRQTGSQAVADAELPVRPKSPEPVAAAAIQINHVRFSASPAPEVKSVRVKSSERKGKGEVEVKKGRKVKRSSSSGSYESVDLSSALERRVAKRPSRAQPARKSVAADRTIMTSNNSLARYRRALLSRCRRTDKAVGIVGRRKAFVAAK